MLDTVLESCGFRFAQLRKNLGLSQRQAAIQMGLSSGLIAQIERNITKPSRRVLLEASRVYDVSIDYLLTGQLAPAACDQPTNLAGHWAQRKAECLAADAARGHRLTLSALRFVVQPEAVIPAEVADGSAPVAGQDQASGSTPWGSLQTREQAEAFLASASGEELRAMAAHLLADHQASREEALPRQLIGLVLAASGALSRRLTSAMQAGHLGKMRWRRQESAEGKQP